MCLLLGCGRRCVFSDHIVELHPFQLMLCTEAKKLSLCGVPCFTVAPCANILMVTFYGPYTEGEWRCRQRV